MTTKEWLLRAWYIDDEINELKLAQKKELETPQYSSERVQTSTENTSENAFIRYSDYSILIDRRIDELYDVKRQILNAINKLDDAVLRKLLIARYINFKTWEQISMDLNYGRSHICRLHGEALKKIKMVQNETK